MKIFKNSTYNETFFTKGYVKFLLFDEKQLEKIKHFYFENIAKKQKELSVHDFHATSSTSNSNLIKEVDSFLKPIFIESLNQHLYNCSFILTNFLVKEPTKYSTVTPHLDLSFVDEPTNVSFNVWVSVDDCDKNSGNLQFVEGSHLFSQNLRVSPDQAKYFDNYQGKVTNFMTDLTTKAGECVIFHHNLIHASRKNTSGKARISCIISGYNSEAQLKHFFYDKLNNIVEEYHCIPDSFLELIHDERPPYSHLKNQFEYSTEPLSYKEFKKLCLKNTTMLKYIGNVIRNKFEL